LRQIGHPATIEGERRERIMASSAQRVIVAYDGSADADRGLDWAVDHAEARGLPIEVVASSGDLEYLPERTAAEADQLVQGWLGAATARLKESGHDDWTTTATRDRIVPALIDASRSASLLVLGAQGHGVLGGMVLGSVSQHVTRHAHCPVVVVRGPHTSDSDRVVVGVDGSQASLKALAFAFDHAEPTGGTVVAVHGRSMTAMTGPWDVDVAPAVAEEMESAQRLLAEAVAGLREEHPHVTLEMEPMPLPAIRALADASLTASLVVVGTRGRGGFVGLLLGSVSASVLQHAHCPVAVVR
jgi:nucleotide-binding universal stress UspA family protein